MQLSRNNSWLFSPSNMSPASFALKPCGCCFLFTSTHCFSLLFLSSLSALWSFLFTSFYKLLQAVLFTHSDSSGHLFIFIFVSFSADTPRPYPATLISESSKKPPVGRRKWKPLFSWLHSFSKSCFSFYPNLCPQSQCCPLCLEGDSDCFLPFAFLFLSDEECRWQGTRGGMHHSLQLFQEK